MQIPDGDGALALHVMPRYMLHNNLQAGVQYKQQARTLFGNVTCLPNPAPHIPCNTDTSVCIQPLMLCLFS
jgi:hypothetical protein